MDKKTALFISRLVDRGEVFTVAFTNYDFRTDQEWGTYERTNLLAGTYILIWVDKTDFLSMTSLLHKFDIDHFMKFRNDCFPVEEECIIAIPCK